MAKIHEIVEIACKNKNMNDLQRYNFDKNSLLVTDNNNNIPLMIAAEFGYIDAIKLLDDKADELLGYDVYKIFKIRNNEGLNALSIAAKNQHVEAVIKLYELGAYDTFSANQNDWEMYANMQIDKDIDPKAIANTLKQDALRRLTQIYRKNVYNLVIDSNTAQSQLLPAIRKLGNINDIVYDDNTALFHAVLHGNVSAVKLLLEERATVYPEIVPNALDSKNNEIISLLSQNIPIHTSDASWGSLLDILFEHAIKNNDAPSITHLVPIMTIAKLQEALLYSSELGANDSVKCLLRHKVSVNSLENNHRKRTPLMLAVKGGHVTTANILLENKANIHIRSEGGIGLTAIDYAKIYRRKECIHLLRCAYAYEKFNRTTLTQAIADNDVDLILDNINNSDDLNLAVSFAKEIKLSKDFIKSFQDQAQNKIKMSQIKRFMN